MRRCRKMINRNNKKLTEELLKVQVEEVDSAYIQDEFSNMQIAINEIIEQLSVSNLDEHRIEIIDQLVQICNNVLDQICINLIKEVL